MQFSYDGSAGSQKTVIAVIPKGTTHVFWKSIHSGAKEAADEFGVEILWKGPMREDERGSQIKLVEHRVTRRVDGIVLAPLDDKALVRPVHEALDKNIPVIIIDSALDSDRTASFVATDNFKGGQMAAQELGRLLGGKGTALMLRYQEGSASTEKREKGFLDVMEREFPEIQMVSTNQYARAMPLPIPLLPPVTSAIFPVKPRSMSQLPRGARRTGLLDVAPPAAHGRY